MTTPRAITLDCGLPLVVEPLAGMRSVALCWTIPAGAAHEPTERQGMGAMLSELLLRGAGDLDSRQSADALDRLGVVRDTAVTQYNIRLSASCLGERLDAALPLLADIVLRPRIDASQVEPCRDLALQDLSAIDDNPQERASLLLSQRHNPLPLNRCTMGTAEGLAAVTREDLVNFWARQARPEGSVITIAGAVDADGVARRLNALLAGWAGTTPALRLVPSPTAGRYHHELDDSASQVQILLAHEAPPERDPRCVLERVALVVLSGGPSSRLFTEIREKRALCYSVSASYSPDREFGRVTAYVGTTPDKAQQSLDVLRAELDRVNGTGGGGVTAEEFARAITQARSALVFAGESTAARAAALASDMHRLGRARPLAELDAALRAVTLTDLNNYLAERRPPAPTIQTLGPRALQVG